MYTVHLTSKSLAISAAYASGNLIGKTQYIYWHDSLSQKSEKASNVGL